MDKRPKSANANDKPKKRLKKKLEWGLDIQINEVMSRAGKATTDFYMPLAQTQKAQDNVALGLEKEKERGHKKKEKKEIVPGLRALRK